MKRDLETAGWPTVGFHLWLARGDKVARSGAKKAIFTFKGLDAASIAFDLIWQWEFRVPAYVHPSGRRLANVSWFDPARA